MVAPPVSPFVGFIPEPGFFRYDEARARRVIRFVETFCVHTKGRFAGRPFLLSPWQKDRIIRPLYGTLQFDSQLGEYRRQYSIAWLEKSRKQGKSQILSALGLYHLVSDDEESAEVYGVAADRDQASLVYAVARRMVELSPALSAQVEVIDSRKRLVYHRTNSFYQVLPGDAAGALGVNASAVLFDEVLTQRNRDLWDAMRQSFGTRVQPLMIAATTAAYTTATFALAEHEHSVNVQAHPWIDPARFAFVRNGSQDADYRFEGLPACPDAPMPLMGATPPVCRVHAPGGCGGPDGTGWYYVAPGLGDFFSIETMRAELREVESKPAALQAFLVFRLNRWESQASRWLDMRVWALGASPSFTGDGLVGRPCSGGIDLASTRDFTACVLLFPGTPSDPADRGYTVLAHFWVPRAAVVARTGMADRFAMWERDGWLTVTEGPTTDYDGIYDYLCDAAERYQLGPIGYDPWNAAHLVRSLDDHGQTTIKVPQSAARLNDPSKRLETLVAETLLYHGGNPVLAWMAGNTELDVTGEGLVKPSKRRSGEKIDGVSALVTALFVALIPEDETPPDVEFIPLGDYVDETGDIWE